VRLSSERLTIGDVIPYDTLEMTSERITARCSGSRGRRRTWLRAVRFGILLVRLGFWRHCFIEGTVFATLAN
jgi:hypothetical protein